MQCIWLLQRSRRYLPLAGLIDVEKELERLGKQSADLQKAAESYSKKLSSPSVSRKVLAEVEYLKLAGGEVHLSDGSA